MRSFIVTQKLQILQTNCLDTRTFLASFVDELCFEELFCWFV